MKRTTLLLDDGVLLDAKHLADQRGMTFTAIVDEALRAYIDAHRPPRRLLSVGIGHSGRSRAPLEDGVDEAELRVGTDPIEGWSPRRRNRSVEQRHDANASPPASRHVASESQT